MEADSTTLDSNLDNSEIDSFPFTISPDNFKVYKELTEDIGKGTLERQIVERLHTLGVLLKTVKCPTGKPECNVTCKTGRVIDRVQWVCESCGVRQPIRQGSFFQKLQCSILRALQIILAWSEDADYEIAAKHFDVKLKVVNMIYDKLEELACNEQQKCKLGGENSVVLVEMYPDCLNRLSPDTTDQPHSHKILMLADTNHIPTQYSFHVMKEYPKKTTNNRSLFNKVLKTEIEEIIANATLPNSLIVSGNNVPLIDGATSVQNLAQHSDADMQHFLSLVVWRGALGVCGAARGAGAAAARRYLHAAALRAREPALYARALALLAADTHSHLT